jgi:putative hydrolase of the HAD superfamily
MIKALLFDYDGLIQDTETPEVEAWQTVYARYGVEFPVALWGRIVGGNGGQDFDPAAYLAERSARPVEPGLAREDRRVRDRALVSLLPARAGVLAYLQDGRRLGLKLAIASSSRREWIDGQLHRLGLKDYFDAVICREQVERVKPDPALFLAALQALSVGPEEALVFEDSTNGVRAGKAAGIRVVAVPNPVTALLGVEGADLTLGSLEDLPLEDLLARLEA